VDHGKVLILDGAVNLAESDTAAYTHQLMDLKNVRVILYTFINFYLYGGSRCGLAVK
jgi:hypothetical protein